MEKQEKPVTLEELRKKSFDWRGFFREKFAFIFNPKSLFYFSLLILFFGILWMGLAVFTNSFSVLYGWDYTSQYVMMGYNFWDTWHNFFKTGYFELYSTGTFLGTDNIGSNSYYGLFDPFLVVSCLIFPRAWMPQIYVIATLFKCLAAALALRYYLKYMGVSEGSSRLGAVVFAFSGYINFFAGFPTYLSMAFTLPLILVGIEQVLKEKRITSLVIGLCFCGTISFFFLIVFCFFGVLYAGWRYFQTIKKRKLPDNFIVIGIGVLGFVLGIGMSAWTLLPSIRETSLSGRTMSVGMAYLNALTSSLKGLDIATFFKLMFEPVGLNSGRELQGLIGFFYPTCNYMWLPLAKGSFGGGTYNYDSWTSSLFVYTPMIILFFTAMYGSITRKKWSHLAAIAIGLYMVFTNFSYYFFYAFAGDGYGRWYIILIPVILYYACQELDRLKGEKKWVLPAGTFTAAALTMFTFLITVLVLKDKTIEYVNIDGYIKDHYEVPGTVVFRGATISLMWLVIYQIVLVVGEGIVFLYFHNHKHFKKVLLGFISIELIVSGNISFIYGYMTPYRNFLNGQGYYQETTQVFDRLKDIDNSYYRSYTDSVIDTNSNMVFGYNGTSTFHSLFNYDLSDLARYSYITNNEGIREAYGQEIINKSWSSYYGNKRFGFDNALGTKYYVIRGEGYIKGYDDFTPNVPFGSELVFSTDNYRVYENPYSDIIGFGHAVDNLYQEGLEKDSSTRNSSDFFHNYAGSNATMEIMRNENVYLTGGIVEDDMVNIILEDLNLDNPNNYAVQEAPNRSLSYLKMEKVLKNLRYVETVHNDELQYGFFCVNDEKGINWDPTYFLDHLDDPNVVVKDETYSNSTSNGTKVARDFGKVISYPRSGWGEYFNDDPNGAYFVLDFSSYTNNSQATSFSVAPRIYFVGDKFDEEGNMTEENVLLSYEWYSLNNWITRKVNGSGGSFGFYPEGRVKYIIACYKGNSGTISYRDFTSYMMERSDLETLVAPFTGDNYALKNVKYWTDNFTFDTDFTERRLVTTSLGYDAGWQLTATDSEGLTQKVNTYRLNGGFLGFVAPQGDFSYHLTYMTPSLKEGAAIAMVCIGGFIAFQGISFLVIYLKEKKEKQSNGNI